MISYWCTNQFSCEFLFCCFGWKIWTANQIVGPLDPSANGGEGGFFPSRFRSSKRLVTENRFGGFLPISRRSMVWLRFRIPVASLSNN